MSRYLWAVGKNAEAFRPGDFLTDRYHCQGRRIFLDTQSMEPPENLDEVPEELLPYLRLSPYQIHIPQVYDWIALDSGSVILLLEQAPLYTAESLISRGLRPQVVEDKTAVQLFPSLAESWSAETPLRQLHWLWQMANLWEPMSAERVASSLLYPELLRVEGPILRLLELRFDASPGASLSNLGQSWLNLTQLAHPLAQEPMQQICQQLIQGQIRTAEMLVAALDQSLARIGQSQQTRTLHIATLSDKGPSRQRNEDACYPESGTIGSSPPAPPLVIVCDGIGGHQGGDVASNLAIQTIKDHLLSLQVDNLSPEQLTVKLEKTVCAANEVISQQNDAEQRFDRQRMGTTVVMGLVRGHELYITHVGDSRAYWITRWGCHQVTQDDDVASREVRLGYNTYSQALQQPSAGSLVQALGMSASNLYPTVQRFILDEDSVFLLCSDGLSDNDRIEDQWEAVILPLLTQGKDLATVSRELVEIANTLNGYDNTTIALIHCQISGDKSPATLQPSRTVIPSASTTIQPTSHRQTHRAETALFSPGLSANGSATVPTARTEPAFSNTPTKIPEPSDYRPKKRSGNGGLLLGIIALSGILAALIAVLFGWAGFIPGRQDTTAQGDSNEPTAATEGLPQPTQASPTEVSVQTGDVLRVNQALNVRTTPPTLDNSSEPLAVAPVFIRQGSIVSVTRVDRITPDDPQSVWLELAVCASEADDGSSDEGSAEEGLIIDPPFELPPTTPESVNPSVNAPADRPNDKPVHGLDLELTIVATDGEGLGFEPPPEGQSLEQGQRAWIRKADLTSPRFNRSMLAADRTICDTALSQPFVSPSSPQAEPPSEPLEAP